MKIPPVGLQLYTVKTEWSREPLETLRRLAKIGYEEVELFFHEVDAKGRIKAMPAAELAAELKASNLRVFATHISSDRATDWDDLIRYNCAVGSAGIVVASAFFDEISDAYRLADWMNTKAELCRENGLALYYHNHYHEFQELDGEIVLDVLLEQTSPENLQLELDVYWVTRAGIDPVTYLRKVGGRVGALHVKDLAKTAEPVSLLPSGASSLGPGVVFSAAKPADFVEVGTGRIDMAAILTEAAKIPSIRHLVIEQDHCSGDEMAAAATSFANLAKIAQGLA
jgi:sugar phosphate isomerase/epimerase